MRHNKKRNVGIIYEQLSQAFSESLVEKDKKRSMLVKKIIDDHYQKDGEIFKDGDVFKFKWKGSECGYATEKDAKEGLKKVSGKAKG